ncbi:L,D-transpeptidase [Terrihabitans rhizophilus]|uniref:L,D-transpeptidase n=1 Tax=Terrihabitans rhizophilus TaxID=3092662 RepID=A0ABU4RJD4_9HYPH|nr:L,D-transpeptidase [Terrihabitans sp. PJ23]MDX6804656.1 L,D-transpeptidase [Terrihabitans sp. PJ23]
MPFQTLLRPVFVSGALAVSLVLGGCVTDGTRDVRHTSSLPTYNHHPDMLDMYGPLPNEKFPIPATDISHVHPQFLRQVVDYNGPEQPGTIVVDTQARFLYLVQENRSALRYGIGVGREGLTWDGRATIKRKAMWPRWTPTADMIAREPERNAQWAGGMEGGLGNPLGSRALYLFQGNRDTLYRIHGTTEPNTIGTAVSSGCIRMFAQDIVDLYQRVPTGTEVVVIQGGMQDQGPMASYGQQSQGYYYR